MIPAWLWLYDHGKWRTGNPAKQIGYWLHWAMILLGIFFLVGGTYATVQEIIDAYAGGQIGKSYYQPCIENHPSINILFIGSAFSCADNSNSS